VSMLSADQIALRGPLVGMLVAPTRREPRSLNARRAVNERTERQSRAQELAPVAARDLVRGIAAIAILLTLWLSVVDVLQLAFLPKGSPGDLRAGILAAAITIPLHVRHLIYGVRGDRPPAGMWTLSLMAIVTVAAAFVAGDGWCREFAPLAVSVLIVVPGRWRIVLAIAVALTPVLIVGPQWYVSDAHPLPGIYFAAVVVWRGITQFVPLRLLAVLRALDSASEELETRAVVQTRVRIDTELRSGVGSALEQIVARGERALAAAANDPAGAAAELRHLVSESRRGLADARRVVAGYRASSVRAELDAAASLLEASGASVRVVAVDGMSLDSPDEHARGVIRRAVVDALRGEARSSYAVLAARDSAGQLSVRVIPDDDTLDGVQSSA
jgi:hypothetical protein